MPTKDELEAEKLQAEIDKLRAESKQLLPSIWSRAGEFTKIFGAVIATVVAIAAAITTYQITELKTTIATRDKNDADRERDAAEKELETVEGKLKAVRLTKAQLEGEMKTLEGKVGDTQKYLAQVQPGTTTPASANSIQQAKATLSDSRPVPKPFVFIVPTSASQVPSANRAAALFTARNYDFFVRSPTANQHTLPDLTEIRYFSPSMRDQATDILNVLKGAGLRAGTISYVNDPDIGSQRYFEIRFSRNAELNP